jgi:HNH endonuclease
MVIIIIIDSNLKSACRRGMVIDVHMYVLITFAGEPIEVAHIYPFSMRNVREDLNDWYSFWRIPRFFWSRERVNRWYGATFPRGTEIVENLMCLVPHMRKYHERAQLAL